MTLKNLNLKDLSQKNDLVSWIQLSRSPNIGPVTFFQLIEKYHSAQEALEALPEWARRGGRMQDYKIFSRENVLREIEAHDKYGATLLSFYDEKYPELLRNIYDPPPVISIKGNAKILNQKIIGMVGARNASLNGQHFTSKLAKELGDHEIIIASGLARGIDTAAHKGSIESGTIAVLAGGIDYIYPLENETLYNEIAEKGLIIAETPFQTIPHASFFPRRNRIISGLSKAVIIVEAALKSGSLITAKFALEQGREVFAVPGSPLDPRCHGTNHLIRQGAILIQSSQEVIEELEQISYKVHLNPENEMLPLKESTNEQFDKQLCIARPIILESLSYSPVSVDAIIRTSQFSITIIATILLELEIAGRITYFPGNQVSLCTVII